MKNYNTSNEDMYSTCLRRSSSPTEDGLALDCLFLLSVVLVSTDLLCVERDFDRMIDPVLSCYGTYVFSYRSAGNIDHHF